MIRSAMRQYISDDADFATLETWLKRGAKSEEFDAGDGKKTPRRVIERNCLRCHAKSTGSEISRHSPFGPDEFDVDTAQIAKFASPRQAKSDGHASTMPPQYDLPRLILISHMHMLSIPLFTLAVGTLFWFARLPRTVRQLLLPIPMIALVMDFGGWWLAPTLPLGVYLILAGGAAYGGVFGFQVLAVAIDLWRPPTENAPAVGDGTGGQV